MLIRRDKQHVDYSFLFFTFIIGIFAGWLINDLMVRPDNADEQVNISPTSSNIDLGQCEAWCIQDNASDRP